MHIDLRPRSFGELVGLTFSLSAAHFTRLFPIALVMSAPGIAITIAQRSLDPKRDAVTILCLNLAAMVISFVVWPLASAASIKIVASSYTGTRCSLAEGLAVGFRRLWPLLGCTVAVGLLVGLGAMLLLVPGLVWMVTYYVAPCSVVLENKNVGGSMGRSRQLTAGHRWTVFFLVMVVTVLMQFIPGVGIGVLMEMGLQNAGAIIVTLVVQALFSVPSVIAPVVVFFDLRVRKEALDVVMLTELVDQIGARLPKQATA